MTHPAGLDFLVSKSDWKRHRFDDAPVPEIGDGQVLFRVDRFAFTANNISYALAGDVIASNHPGVAEGTRCFGFYPMSRYLVIEPSAAGPGGIMDGASHREGLAPAYNQYSPTGSDALYQPEHEDALMLMRGLFMTSFLADDSIAEKGFGEQLMLISSASSKTSIALAHLVSTSGRVRAVGLTSERNLEFVRKLGCYDQVPSLDAATPSVYVDMAGNGGLRRSVHEHLGDQLTHSCTIGATHWDQTGGGDEGLPGPKPEFFFAPGQIQKRAADWGPAELQRKLAEAWAGFRTFSEGWLLVQRGAGREAIERVYEDTLAGRAEPRHGHVLSLWDAA
jgi:hypothetical protein